MKLKFSTMQGVGNDFVVLDGIGQMVALTPGLARHIADRHFGIGCDQILLVERPRGAGADFRYRIWNADGGETLACGTGACAAVVAGIRRGLLAPIVAVDTRGGPLTIRWEGAENGLNCAVWLTGPAVTVFEGEIQIDES